jgi:autotransporter-associated beta strand protein
VASVANTSGAFGNNSAVTLANVAGASLDITGFNTQIGSLTGGGATGGNVTLGAATLTVGGDNTSPAAFAGVISGTGGSLTKIGTGMLDLNGTNTYTGVTTINAGTLSVGTIGNGGVAGNLGQASNAAANLVLGGGTLQYTGATASTNRSFTLTAGTTSTIDVNTAATNLTVSGSSTNTTGGLTKVGAGTLTLSGANLYTGATTVSAGTLKAGVASVANTSGAFGNNSAVTLANVAGASLDITGFNTQIGSLTGGGATGGNVTLGAATLTVGGDNTSPAAFAGVISGTGGSLTKIGTGMLDLNGTNTYTGVTTINAGTLSVGTIGNGGVAGNIGQASNAAANLVLGGGTLQYTGATASTDRSFTLTAGTTSTIDVNTAATNLTVSGSSTNTTGGLTKVGAGTLTLSGANLYTGATTVSAGTLVANGSSSLGGTTGNVAVSNGGTLALAGGAAITSGSPTNSVTITKSGTLDLNGAGASGSTGALQATGSTGQTSQWLGNITLSGNATISAADNLLIIGNATVGNYYNNTLNLGGNTLTIKTTSATGVTPAFLSYSPYLLDQSNILLNSTISGTGGIIKTGAGTLNLVNAGTANSYSGSTVVTGGTLIIDGPGNAPVISSTSVTVGNAVSPGTADSVVLRMGQAASPPSVNNLIGTSSSSTASTSMTVYEDGLFNMNGGSNSLINLTLQGGHVSGGNPSYSALLTLTGGVTSNASSQTALIENGYLAMSSNSFAFNVANGAASTDLRVDSVIQNGVGFTGGNSATSLAKTNSGTLLLTGANSYSGVTDIQGGVLAIQNSSALGQGGSTSANGTKVAAGAQLQLDGSAGNLTIANESLALNGNGTSVTGELRNVSGDNTYNGTITLGGNSRINSDSGLLTIANTSGPGASIITGDVAGRSLTVGGSGNIAINSVVASNIGTLIKDGTGTVTLAGDYSANATTTVQNGTLELNMGGTTPRGLSSATSVTIGDNVGAANSATLLLSQSNQIADSAAVTLNTDGQFNVNNNSDTVGSIAGSGNILLGTGQLIAGGTNASTTFSGTLSGASSSIFTKTGSGTLTISNNLGAGSGGNFLGTLNLNAGTILLSANNTFSGNVNIAAGTTLKLSSSTINIANLNFTGSGTITLDFGGLGSTLNVTNTLSVGAGITLNIINWTNASDYFFAANWTGAVLGTTGTGIENNVIFDSPTWTGANTKWQSYDHQITPVPEPSTYGALLLGAMGVLVGCRRYRLARAVAVKLA